MLEVSSIQVKAAYLLRQAAGMAIVVASVAGLGGCQGSGAIGGGEGLFHDLEGGAVAEQRPPPPGVNDPYPNLGTMPKRPPAPDVLAQQKLADQLASQRDQAEQAAAASPLTARPAPPPIPKAPATPDPNANRVVVDAAAAPPPPPKTPAAKAPATPATASPGTTSAIPSLASIPAVPAATASGAMPDLAVAPPPEPTGLGTLPNSPVAAPTVTAAATTPAAAAPSTPPPAALAKPATPAAPKSWLDALLTPPPKPVGDTIVKIAAPTAGNSVTIDFTPGSAELPPSATLNLRRFALAHRGSAVTVTGHGGDVLPGADPQSRALDLALRRAQAIATSLGAAGVSAANLHVHAEAAGLGGSANL